MPDTWFMKHRTLQIWVTVIQDQTFRIWSYRIHKEKKSSALEMTLHLVGNVTSTWKYPLSCGNVQYSQSCCSSPRGHVPALISSARCDRPQKVCPQHADWQRVRCTAHVCTCTRPPPPCCVRYAAPGCEISSVVAEIALFCTSHQHSRWVAQLSRSLGRQVGEVKCKISRRVVSNFNFFYVSNMRFSSDQNLNSWPCSAPHPGKPIENYARCVRWHSLLAPRNRLRRRRTQTKTARNYSVSCLAVHRHHHL